MNKLAKKISALMLAAAVAVSAITPAFAANSPISGKSNSDTSIEATTTSGTTATITDVSSTGSKAVIPAYITMANGDVYGIDAIASGAIKAKYDQVTFIMNNNTRVKAKVFKTKAAKKTKKVVFKASAKGSKLTAKQFNKKAFKGFKGKIVIKKSAMSKKQYKKLVKKLRKGGFKGKIVRKK